MAEGNPVFSKDQVAYIQIETSFGNPPNTTGTATVGNGNACLVETLKTDADQALIDNPDKTGSLDALLGQAGRRGGTWSASMALPVGSASGTAPNIGPFIQAAMGKAPVIVASTSVTYGVDDLSPSLTIYNFRKPATATQQAAIGAVVDTMTLELGQDVAKASFAGTSLWVLDTDQFSTADTVAKGGYGGATVLSAFPAEPSAPTINTTFVVGFKGAITLDGNTYATIRNATINFKANRDVPKDVFNSSYGSTPGQDVRDISGTINMYDETSDNATPLPSFKLKALLATPVTLIFQVGTTAGGIYTLTASNVQLQPAKYDDSQRKYALNLNWKAHASGIRTKDSFQIAIT